MGEHVGDHLDASFPDRVTLSSKAKNAMFSDASNNFWPSRF
jgi:hypothetical protein